MTKVRPFEDPVEKTDLGNDLRSTLRPLTYALQIWALYIPRNRKGYSRCLQWMYCIFILCILWVNAMRVGALLKQATGFSENLTTTSSMFIFYFFLAYLCTLILFITTWKLDDLFDTMTKYHRKYGYAYNRTRLFKILSLYCVMSVGSSVLSTGLICYIWGIPGGRINRFLYPFDGLSENGSLAGTVVIGVMMSIAGCTIYMLAGFFFTCCYCLSKEFDTFNKKVKEFLNSGTTEYTDFRLHHADICRVLTAANGIITHVLFSGLAAFLPLSSLLLYGVIAGSLPLQDMLLLLAMVLYTTLGTFGTIVVSAILNGKAHGCLSDLISCKLDSLPQETLIMISIFTRRLTGPPIGFHVYGLFTIETSTILMILGTLLTYAVAVLTFSP